MIQWVSIPVAGCNIEDKDISESFGSIIKMDIRLFSESDRRDLQEIYLETRTHAFNWINSKLFKADDFDRDTEGEIIWVATRSTRLLGFVSVWKPENFIHNLFVRPDAARQGVGSALLDECLNNIGRPVVLKCGVQNYKARDFYLAKGWRTASEGEGADGKYLLMHFDNEIQGLNQVSLV